MWGIGTCTLHILITFLIPLPSPLSPHLISFIFWYMFSEHNVYTSCVEVCPFMTRSFCSTKFGKWTIGVYTLQMVYLFLLNYCIYQYIVTFLSLLITFCLRFTFSEIRMTTLAWFQALIAWNIVFHPFTFIYSMFLSG